MDQYPLVASLGILAITFFYSCFGNIYLSKISALPVMVFHLLTAFALLGQVADVALFATAGYTLRNKIDIYWLDPAGGTYSFFPLLIFPYGLFYRISSSIPLLNFSFLIKLILIPSLLLTSWAVGKLAKTKKVNLQLLLNPIIFWAVTFHGQADILLIMFFLLALVNFKKTLASGLFFALSILVKTWSVMFLPLFIKIKRSFIFFIILAATLVLDLVIYKFVISSSFKRILYPIIFHPSGSAGYWGITALSEFLGLPITQFYSDKRIIFLGLGLLAAYLFIFLKKLAVEKAALLIVLSVYAFTAGWGLQYTAWVIPFGLAAGQIKMVRTYTWLALPYLTCSYLLIAWRVDYLSLSQLAIALGLIPWLYCLFWIKVLLKQQEAD